MQYDAILPVPDGRIHVLGDWPPGAGEASHRLASGGLGGEDLTFDARFGTGDLSVGSVSVGEGGGNLVKGKNRTSETGIFSDSMIQV